MYRIRKWLFLLLPLILLIPLLLIAFARPSLLGTLAQSLTQSAQGGQGGAYGANSINILAVGKMYGGAGPGGSCKGTSGTIEEMLKFDFTWDAQRIAAFVNPQWQHDTTDQLCNDHYIWQSSATQTAQNVVEQLQWPDGIQFGNPRRINPQWADHQIALRPLQDFDPRTLQAQQSNSTTPTPTQSSQGKMYGGAGSHGTCEGTSGTITKMLAMDFGWNQTQLTAAINRPWQHVSCWHAMPW